MRFRLIGLFGVVTLAAVVCGIVFALPLVGSTLVLTFLLGISPGVWISGAIFAKGGTRAFFLGGLLAGVAPFAIVMFAAAYSSVIIVASGQAAELELMYRANDLLYRLLGFGIWLIPGLFSFAGGAISWLTYRIVRPANDMTPSASGTESVRDYQVIAGRLTTSTPVPAVSPSRSALSRPSN